MTGASIGAINAAVFAWEYERTGDMISAAETVKSIWSELDGLFKFSFLRIIGEVLRSYLTTRSPVNFPSLVDNTKIQNKLKELIPDDVKISDIKRIELAITPPASLKVRQCPLPGTMMLIFMRQFWHLAVFLLYLIAN